MKYFIKMFDTEREVTYSQYKEAMKEAGLGDSTPLDFAHKLFSGRIEETKTREDILVRTHNILCEMKPKGKTLKKSFDRVIEYISRIAVEEAKA